jgi:hypothetical protein
MTNLVRSDAAAASWDNSRSGQIRTLPKPPESLELLRGVVYGKNGVILMMLVNSNEEPKKTGP